MIESVGHVLGTIRSALYTAEISTEEENTWRIYYVLFHGTTLQTPSCPNKQLSFSLFSFEVTTVNNDSQSS